MHSGEQYTQGREKEYTHMPLCALPVFNKKAVGMLQIEAFRKCAKCPV